MKILSLGLDNSILKKDSQLRERVLSYADLVDKYFVVVPDIRRTKEELNDKVSVFGSGGSNKIVKLFKIYFLGEKLIKENKFDVITVQDQYYLALVAWFLAKKFNIGLEIQVHGFEKFSGARKLVAKFVIKRSYGIRTVSQRLKKKLVDEFEIREDSITVVPIYSELKIKNEKLKIKNGKDEFIFLTVGRFVEVKNIEMQIRAISNIVKKHPEVKLWLVGDGALSKKLKVESRKLGLSDNVKFFGWIDSKDELNNFYAQADAFLLTSSSEGWGMVVLEAATHGLPIIMTDVGLAGEVIQDNKNGLVIPVNDQRILEENMIELIEDKELRNKLSKNVLETVKNLSSKDEINKLYLKSWQNVTKQKIDN